MHVVERIRDEMGNRNGDAQVLPAAQHRVPGAAASRSSARRLQAPRPLQEGLQHELLPRRRPASRGRERPLYLLTFSLVKMLSGSSLERLSIPLKHYFKFATSAIEQYFTFPGHLKSTPEAPARNRL